MDDSNFVRKSALPRLPRLAWVGALALSLVAPFGSQARAEPVGPSDSQCVVDPDNVVTCSGNLLAGVHIDSDADDSVDYETLYLRDLIGHAGEDDDVIHIMSEPGRAGIFFRNSRDNADILLEGDPTGILLDVGEPDSGGIIILANENSGKVTLNYWGNTRANESYGVYIKAAEVVMDYFGDIETVGQGSSHNHGIYVKGASAEGHLLQVKHQGTITTKGGHGHGIYVIGENANHIRIERAGEIDVEGLFSNGIFALSSGRGGNIFIDNRGKITASTVGIVVFASTSGTESITIFQAGDIEVTRTDGDAMGIRILKTNQQAAEIEVSFTGRMSVHASGNSKGVDLATESTPHNNSVSIGDEIIGLDGQLKSGAHITATSDNRSGVGVHFRGGASNQLETYNEVVISGSTFDVLGATGNETITNYGTLTMPGDTDLGEGTNAFNNEGVFHSGRTLDLGDDANLFTNSGIVSIFGDDTIGTTQITGSWIGQPGSGLRIDAMLDDGSSQKTDILAVSGATSGTTLVYVKNQGGAGGWTGRGDTDGIQITDIGGESNGVFELGQPVFGGLVEYDLVKADEGNWYLQSMQNSISDAAISSVQIPRSLHTFGTALTGSRKDRLNDQSAGESGNAYGLALDQSKIPGSWARIVGGRREADGTVSGGVFSADASSEENLWAIQGGFTAFTDDDRLTGSVFLHYGGVDTDFTNDTRGRSAGSTEMDAWGGGISVTWLDPRGFYLDGVATITTYDIDMRDSNNDESNTDARASSLSVEVGTQLEPIREIQVTPHLQLIYQTISIDDHTDTGGNHIFYDDENSLELRVGSIFEVAVNDSISLYSQLNILHQLLDAPTVTFGNDGVPVSMDWDDTSYEARLGVRLSPRDAPYSGYVEANYRAPFDSDGDTETWSATGGLSYRF